MLFTGKKDELNHVAYKFTGKKWTITSKSKIMTEVPKKYHTIPAEVLQNESEDLFFDEILPYYNWGELPL